MTIIDTTISSVAGDIDTSSSSASSASSGERNYTQCLLETLSKISQLDYFTRPCELSVPLTENENVVLDKIDCFGKTLTGDKEKISSDTCQLQSLRDQTMPLVQRHTSALEAKLEEPMSTVLADKSLTLKMEESIAMRQYFQLLTADDALLCFGNASTASNTEWIGEGARQEQRCSRFNTFMEEMKERQSVRPRNVGKDELTDSES
ncbi:hypothetical protein M231_02125 [Tremella mesenterica]|uniref:Uncharacterized protein n=1 Tax=Tremella mesenterica TaxID=5217 RepID=A0A4Q1BRR6_TREME|nr:hypothetical protein M231_02125 [Tremella mesenterica]